MYVSLEQKRYSMEWLTTLTNRNAIRLLRRGLENASDTIYPPRCPICEQLVEPGGMACDDCLSRLKYIVSPFCMVCGKQLDHKRCCGIFLYQGNQAVDVQIQV